MKTRTHIIRTNAILALSLLCASFRVSGVDIYVDATVATPGSGLSWATAFNNVQSALTAAASKSGSVVIRVAQGRYRPLVPPIPADPRSATFLISRNNLTIRGGYASGGGTYAPTLYRTILTGDIGVAGVIVDNSYHVITFSGVNRSVILDGVDVVFGQATGTGGDAGGGVYMENSSPLIKSCRFIQNYALAMGGAVYCANGHPSFSNCEFSRNSAGDSGGGIYSVDSTLTLTDCRLELNYATKYGGCLFADKCELEMSTCTIEKNAAVAGGGAIHAERNVLLDLSECSVTENHTLGYGGGVYCYGGALKQKDCRFVENGAAHGGGLSASFCEELSLDGCDFEGNDATDGGGVKISSCDSAVLNQCTFEDNYADNNGAGLSSVGGVAVTNSRFRSNSAARYGGGIETDNDITLDNCEFFANESLGYGGGGVYLQGGTAIPNVVNCTFASNTAAAEGGGIYAYDGNPKITNCILNNNAGSGLAATDQVFALKGFPSVKYTCIQGGWSGVGGTGNITATPLFVNLATGDLRLLAASPCIDAGYNSVVTTTEDLAGNSRIVGAAVDMGAYEAP